MAVLLLQLAVLLLQLGVLLLQLGYCHCSWGTATAVGVHCSCGNCSCGTTTAFDVPQLRLMTTTAVAVLQLREPLARLAPLLIGGVDHPRLC